jgi:hypothetical protein
LAVAIDWDSKIRPVLDNRSSEGGLESIAELLCLARGGDQAALQELLGRYREFVCLLVRSRCGGQRQQTGQCARRAPHPGPSGTPFEVAAQVLIAKGHQTAVGVFDDDDFFDAQQMVRQDERAEHILADNAPRVANHVRLARLEPQRRFDLHLAASIDEWPPMTGSQTERTVTPELRIAVIGIGCCRDRKRMLSMVSKGRRRKVSMPPGKADVPRETEFT